MFQIRLKTLILTVLILPPAIYFSLECNRYATFYRRRNASISSIKNAGGTNSSLEQRSRIVEALETSSVGSIAKPKIAIARWFSRSEGRGEVLLVDWIAGGPEFESMILGFGDGKNLEISSDQIFTSSNNWYYFHSSVHHEYLRNQVGRSGGLKLVSIKSKEGELSQFSMDKLTESRKKQK